MISRHKLLFRIAIPLLLCAAGMLFVSSCYATHAQAVRRAERMLSELSDSASYDDPKKQALLAYVCEGFGDADAFPIRERSAGYFHERFGWGDLLYCDASETLLRDDAFISRMGKRYESGYIVFLYRRGFAQPDAFRVTLMHSDSYGEKKVDSFTFYFTAVQKSLGIRQSAEGEQERSP